MDGIALLGLWCTVLSVAFVWPQVARVYRQHTVEGIAPKGTLHVATASAFWLMYGLALGDVAISVANGAVVAAQVLIGVQQIRHGTLARRTAVLTVIAVVAVGGLAIAASPSAVGWLAIAAGATSVLPQTLHVLRADSLTGVSVPTYLLLALTATSWAAYGVVTGDALVVITNVMVLPCALLVTARTWTSQRRAKVALVDDPAFA